ncbi:hypothetical protein INT47_002773 [Mucor saturninus]|uniref:Uncharacterized protein n=1 Tax=Mucor saturninus TaxID=64648 RepID=A0A8H7QXQ7_9FUNG|nr:hypothetical protein INT47_002773 [Mucor saturninus]
MNLVYSNLYKHDGCQAKISPDGLFVANVQENRLIIRQHNQGLTIHMVHLLKNPIDYIEWSPNSEYILSCNYEGGRIHVRSLADKNWHGVIKEDRAAMAKAMWTADSKNILYTTELKLLLGIWNLPTLEYKYIRQIKYTDKGIETSPDGNYIAIARKENGKDCISTYSSSTFDLLEHFEVGTVNLQNLKWSPDGMFIAVWDHCLQHKLLVYRQDGKLCTFYSGYDFGLGIKTVQWSPNSQLIALGNYDQTIHLISTRDWKLISILNHPKIIKKDTNMRVLEENALPYLEKNIKSQSEMANFNWITRRPYEFTLLRSDPKDINPKVGIGLFQFSVDSSYIYSRSDSIPNVLWLWQVKSLECHNVIVFKNQVRQGLWNPLEAHMLAVICGDKNLHFLQPTDDGEAELITARVPLNEFSIKRAKWNSNGDSLLMMDSELFCLAVL